MNLIPQIQYWLGIIPLPEQIDRSHTYILHLFDTPSYTYLLLDHLLRVLKVDAVIHNGNLSSQLNLTKNPHSKMEYEAHLEIFARILETHDISKLFICLSPQDHEQSIRRALPFASIHAPFGQATIGNQSYAFAYYQNNLPDSMDDFRLTPKKSIHFTTQKINWNTNKSDNFFIELIDTTTKAIWKLPYPHN